MDREETVTEKRKTISRRDWLNPVGSSDTGSVEWYVDYSIARFVAADLTIRDCSRSVILSFGWDTPGEGTVSEDWFATYEARLEKLDLLLDSLKDLRREMVKRRPRQKKVVKDS